ncbi:hypothetical protein ACSBR2_038851 [Camellia fascicularis]
MSIGNVVLIMFRLTNLMVLNSLSMILVVMKSKQTFLPLTTTSTSLEGEHLSLPVDDLEDRLRVRQEAPWSVMGSLLVLQTLPLGKAIDELEFRWSPFWVQVHGLPFDKMTRAHGEVIGSRIGRLVEIEASSDGLLIHRSFLRLRVEGFILYRRNSSGPVGDGLKVYYKRIGHDKLACKFVSREVGLHSGYGPNQRTGPAKILSVLQSSMRRPTEDLRPGRDPLEPHLHIPISSISARREGTVRDEANGIAMPTPHQLAANVGVRSVRSRVVELGANEPFQSEAQDVAKDRIPLWIYKFRLCLSKLLRTQGVPFPLVLFLWVMLVCAHSLIGFRTRR